MLHQRGEEKSAVILFVLVWKNVVPCSHLPVQHTAEDNIQYIHYINRYTHINTHTAFEHPGFKCPHTHTHKEHILCLSMELLDSYLCLAATWFLNYKNRLLTNKNVQSSIL